MKKSIVSFLAVIVFSCTSPSTDKSTFMEYGSKIDTSNAVTASGLVALMSGKSESPCILKGEIAEVCQSEGCWITLVNPTGEPLLVRMKGESFKVPKDIAGRFVYIQGQAILDTTSVETLKDYAADAGKSQAEIDAISAPKTELIVEADGIVLLKSDAGKK